MQQSDRSRFKSLLKYLILQEATRFKREMGENLPRWKEKLIQYEEQRGNYVHFSMVPRMGLFIRNRFFTPIGFYAYPLDKTKLSKFASERPYAIVFRPKPEAKILDIGTYTEEQLLQDRQKLLALGISEEVMEDAARRATYQTPAGRLWNITRRGSQADSAELYVAKQVDGEDGQPTRGGGPTGAWTMLFRKLGYDGVVDPGFGIIHVNEPAQGVFFNTTKLQVIEVIDKKTEVVGMSTFSRDFSNQDLKGKNFSGRSLEGARFTSAQLDVANFAGAKLDEARFYEASLVGTSFVEAVLRDGSLAQANASRANFTEADLESTTFVNGSFIEANFTGAQMYAVEAREANFQDAVFRRANLTTARLSDSDMTGAILDGAQLTRAILQQTILRAASLKGASFNRASLTEADLRGADLTGALFLDKADLRRATYNSRTKFPEGFDPEDAGMVLVEE